MSTPPTNIAARRSRTRPSVLMCLPNHDFDPTEAAVTWEVLNTAGIDVEFATPDGQPGAGDPHTLRGGFRGPFPARPEAVAAYNTMLQDPRYASPMTWADAASWDPDGVVFPGGHAAGVKPFLESRAVQEIALGAHRRGAVIGAICHGVLVLARTTDPQTGRSILDGKTVTALTKSLERSALWLTFWRVGRRFRTYPVYTEDEVIQTLGPTGGFVVGGGRNDPHVVEDGNVVTARYAVDAKRFGSTLVAKLRAAARRTT
jgi:putative intracellular protease/amidase